MLFCCFKKAILRLRMPRGSSPKGFNDGCQHRWTRYHGRMPHLYRVSRDPRVSEPAGLARASVRAADLRAVLRVRVCAASVPGWVQAYRGGALEMAEPHRRQRVQRRRRHLPNQLAIAGFSTAIAGFAIRQESAAHVAGAILLYGGILAFFLGLFLRSRWPESTRPVQRLG